MKISFVFKHLDHSESLQEYAHGRIDQTLQFLLKQGAGHCHFSKTRSFFSVEIVVNTKVKFFKARAEATDIYSAVDEAVSKLEKQIMKSRKTNKSHRGQPKSKWELLESDFVRYKRAA